jgi:hypothetical protein
MSSPTFKTTEVAQLYKEVQPWCHPEVPFLDPQYSPGSNMPAIDFTAYITTWLETDRQSAIIELWTYLTSDGPEAVYGIRNALTACLPSWIGLSETAKHELHAIYILTLRAAWGGRTLNTTRLASSLASTTLASRQLSLPPDYERGESMAEMARAGKPIVLARAYSEELLKVVRSEIGNFPLGAECGKDEGSRLALEKAMSPLGTAETAAERLKAIPPMARRVVYDRFTRGWGGGALRLNLYYDDRAYGCGSQANQQYMDWLGFFSTPSDHASVPSVLTKDKLLEGLAEHGVPTKKSTPRVALIDQALSIPGLMSSLISRYCPEQRDALPEWYEPIKEWVLRVRYAEPIAAALMNLLATSTMKKSR